MATLRKMKFKLYSIHIFVEKNKILEKIERGAQAKVAG
jgi:hypothetical protein